MGWKLKTLAVFLALVFLAATLWQLSLLIFAALIIPPVARRFTRRDGGGQGRGRRFHVREIAGGVFLILSFIAFAEGGTLSPLLFGGLGLLFLGWGHLPMLSVGSLKPVKDSTLLRNSLVPIRWTAVVEVKPITRDLGKALSGVREPIIVKATGASAIYVTVSRIAFSESSAERTILEDIERMGRGVIPLGAYLLPLDSSQAAMILAEPLAPVELSEDGWALTLSTGAYDVLTVSPSKGFAHSLGLYARAEANAKPGMPGETMRFDHPPLLWEIFKSLDGRVKWPNPDRYTSFLSSIFATGYEPIGSNIIDAGTPSTTSETVVVKSHSSPAVELSRVQLRAIMMIYSQGPPIVKRGQPVPVSPQARSPA